MRILIWNSWITPAGGMERVALSLANGLAERRLEVYLAGPYRQAPVLEQQIEPGVNYVPLQFEKSVRGLLSCSRKLQQLIREQRIDVISAHGSLIPLLGVNPPVVWTEHGLRYGSGRFFSGLKALPWTAVRCRLHTGAWHFVGCSEYVRDGICRQFNLPTERASVIYNGVPSALKLERLPAPRFTEPFQIGFLGRMEEEKHPMDAFTLDGHLQELGVPCEWHMFGAGSQLGAVKQRADEEGGRFHVHGLASSAAEAFARMDLLVFLSHGEMEGLPTVLLEARHARRPAVAWKVTANPEAIGCKEWLVEELFDLEKFALRIAEVLRRRQAPEPVDANELSYERMLDHYEAVLSRQGSYGAAGPVMAVPSGTTH